MKLVQIYFKKLNKVAVISNFLAFFQFLVDKFTLLDPDPQPCFFACLKDAAGAALKQAAPAPGSDQKKIGSGSATLPPS